MISANPTSYLGRDPVTVALTVSDNVGVASVEYGWAASGTAPSAWSQLAGSSVVQGSEGVWYLQVRARDHAGNEAVAGFGPYHIDRTPPVVSVSPSSRSWKSDAVAVSVAVSDAGSGVASCEYAWLPAGASSGSWAPLAGSQLVQGAEGEWYLRVRARDRAGNVCEVGFGPYCVDRTAPSVVVSPSDCAWQNVPVSVSVSVSDSLSGVASREYAWALSGQAPADWRPLEGSAVVQNAEGVWYLHVRARDAAGNVRQVSAGPYRVDKTPPVVSASPAERGWSNRDVEVRVSASDVLSGVFLVEYAWSGSEAAVPSSWSRLAGSSVVQGAEGVWYLHVRARDVAGNERRAVFGPYRVDKTAPEVSFDPRALLPGARFAVVAVKVADALSGVSRAEYSWSHDPGVPGDWVRLGSEPVVWGLPGTWYLHVYALDVAGNVARVAAGPYCVKAAEDVPPAPSGPSEDLPDWWTPPWYQGW